MSIDTPDLQALIELSDDDLCDVIKMDAMQAVKIIRQLTSPTLPGAGGGNALDARRYRWLRANAYEGRMESRGPNPDFALNCDEPESEWDAAIDAAMTPQQGG